MGQASKTNIEIFVGENTPIELSSKTSLHQNLLKFYYKLNPEEVGEPHINITHYEVCEGSIELELYSSRRANLDFQIGLLNHYLVEECELQEEDVTYDTWVQA